MTAIKEEHIVNHIINNWDKFFPDLKFQKKEYIVRNFIVDIAANFDANLKELGISNKDKFCRPPVFFEVKYNNVSSMRTLLCEMQKQLKFREWYLQIGSYCILAVISDKYDNDTAEFLYKNNILMYKIDIKNNDLNTLKISEYMYKDEV